MVVGHLCRDGILSLRCDQAPELGMSERFLMSQMIFEKLLKTVLFLQKMAVKLLSNYIG